MKFIPKFFIFIILLLACYGMGGSGVGAEEYKIAAVVNGDEISSYILERRVDLAIRSSGLPNTDEVRKKVRPQVLEILIDERLKQQEADKLKIQINEADMQDAISEIEKQNHLEPGGFSAFLEKNGLPEDSVLAQIKSQLAWKKIVIDKIRPKISVSDNEVQDQIEVMVNHTGKKQYDLSEIILKVESPEKESEVKSLAEKLVVEIKTGGGDFAAIAKQFSSGGTAADGGNLGLIAPAQLDKKTVKSIERLRAGNITEPIRTDKGFEIFRLNKIKNFVVKDPSESEITLKQIYISLDSKAPADKTDLQEAKLEKVTGKITDCESYEKIAAETPKSEKINFRDFGRLQIKNLAPEIRPVVAEMRPGEPSTVLRNNSSISVFLVCDRKDPEGSEVAIEPDPAQINEMLMGQKIELAARKYLQKLRNEAYIEKRI